MLSSILGVHMEDLLLPKQDEVWLLQWDENNQESRRLKAYEQQREQSFYK